MKIVIASDKSGFEVKEKIKAYLLSKEWDLEDVGLTDGEQYMPFYTAVDNLCTKMQAGEAQRGILICGSGTGVCIAANKYEGIYAVACESVYTARLCRVINDANVITMGAQVVAPEKAYQMCDVFLSTEHAEGMAPERAAYIKKLNEDYMEFLETKKQGGRLL
ncbi:MAG: RpiB/LacA/LacB family sugar-phosphate isomerase [Christensenellales bacterium]|jgi:ribose 5-phosphate isomerase B